MANQETKRYKALKAACLKVIESAVDSGCDGDLKTAVLTLAEVYSGKRVEVTTKNAQTPRTEEVLTAIQARFGVDRDEAEIMLVDGADVYLETGLQGLLDQLAKDRGSR